MVSFALATLKMKAITPEQTREYYDRHVDVYDPRTAFDLRGGHAYNLSRYYLPFLDREVPRDDRALAVLPLVGHFAFRLAWVARKTAP